MLTSWANGNQLLEWEQGWRHWEPPQTKWCQNLINIQTTAAGATSLTWRVVNWKGIKGLNLGCSGFISTPLDPRYYMCFVTAMLQKTSSSRSSKSSSLFLTTVNEHTFQKANNSLKMFFLLVLWSILICWDSELVGFC